MGAVALALALVPGEVGVDGAQGADPDLHGPQHAPRHALAVDDDPVPARLGEYLTCRRVVLRQTRRRRLGAEQDQPQQLVGHLRAVPEALDRTQ